MPFNVFGLAGSLSAPSRTRALIETVTQRAAAQFGASTEVQDLSALQASLGLASRLDDLDAAARAIVGRMVAADALVVGSPVYKGSYGGLFKHLFDLLDPADLAGKPVILTATGGGERHALVVEHQLRPLFAFFEAASLPTAIYAGPADFTDGKPAGAALLARIDRAVGQLAPWALQRLPIAAE